MLKKFLPILIIVVAAGGGGAAGLMLKPEPPKEEAEGSAEASEKPAKETKPDDPAASDEEVAYVKLSNQFVIPVLGAESVEALVVLSLSLEAPVSQTERLYSMEPKLRDASLRVLFDHAFAGGFDGAFTASPKLELLRTALKDAVNDVAGGVVSEILITDIVRQDT